MLTTKLLRQKSQATRKKIKLADEEALAAMTPQQRQIYLMDQSHAERLRPSPEKRNVRYDD